MDVQELARAVAAEFGDDAATETERELRGEPASAHRAVGVVEAVLIGEFILVCAKFAIEIWGKYHDRAQLTQDLRDRLPNPEPLSVETRLRVIERTVDRLAPASL